MYQQRLQQFLKSLVFKVFILSFALFTNYFRVNFNYVLIILVTNKKASSSFFLTQEPTV